MQYSALQCTVVQSIKLKFSAIKYAGEFLNILLIAEPVFYVEKCCARTCAPTKKGALNGHVEVGLLTLHENTSIVKFLLRDDKLKTKKKKCSYQ